jgi:maltooligosyltrehalose trehalohydrolase
MWLEVYGFDGLRLDAVGAIYSFEAVHLLEELASAVHGFAEANNRQIVLVAESDLNDPRLVHPPERGGFGLDAHWADDFHHALHSAMTGETVGYYMDFNGIEDLAMALRDGYVYQGQYSIHRKRRHGRQPFAVRPDQLIVNSQNHDQIGNRAKGERLSMLLTPIQLKAVSAMTILSPFVPLLFQGEEWGASTPFFYFTDHQNKELGRLVAEGRRQEFATFGWANEVPNPQLPETFEASRLDWNELRRPPHQELFVWYQRIIALRAADRYPLQLPVNVGYDAEAGWLWFVRGDLCVAVNFAARPAMLALPQGSWDLLLSSASDSSSAATLAAYEARIYHRQA